MIEFAVQYRTYTDKGWEESTVERTWMSKPWTEESARTYVAQYNVNRDDETGLPAARVVRREVSDWEPPDG